ncbi:hypothetical protein VT84_06835 [Gemmata sp. SH-PL17]|uniref:hypothetical protein n=1 Tax=Gemmata sp. SH-PL17 TaxID=1630693 RepID=UPI00078C4AE9|nr:hypothetical protein [Gemmata sp. SH-PL17]AMV24094.1 hypothetical protein VT84_06835 [Gemmata sp. SH-PL17]
MAIVTEPRAFRAWLNHARQALLDRVSELADAPQEELLAGIADELCEQLNAYQVRPVRGSRRGLHPGSRT